MPLFVGEIFSTGHDGVTCPSFSVNSVQYVLADVLLAFVGVSVNN